MDSILHDHSQTFVGVLASLLLITIIWSHESNFVIKIISERSESIKKVWRALDASFKEGARKWKFLRHDPERMFNEMKSVVYKDFKGVKNRPDISMNLIYIQLFQMLEEEIETYRETFVTDYSRKIMPMIEHKIDSIEKSNKIVVSAIFALMTCILAFILDETMAIFPSTVDFCATFLFLFLILSSSFWLGMWGSFFIRHMPGRFEKDDCNITTAKKESTITTSNLTLICILCLCCVLCCLIGGFISCRWLKIGVVVGMGMLIPSAYIGFRKMRCRDYSQKNPYTFSINHFIDFCLLATVWSGALFFGSFYWNGLKDVFFIFENWDALLAFLELFLLLTGVICPIFLPYLNTYILLWYMKLKMNAPRKKIRNDKRWKTINEEIEKLYRSVSTNPHWHNS